MSQQNFIRNGKSPFSGNMPYTRRMRQSRSKMGIAVYVPGDAFHGELSQISLKSFKVRIKFTIEKITKART